MCWRKGSSACCWRGCEPGRILCLTFTKAAAANMAERVFQTLSKWTALDDEALCDAIEATGAPRPRERKERRFRAKTFRPRGGDAGRI